VGSTVNGCGAYNSDMDLCCYIPGQNSGNRQYAIRALRRIQKSFFRKTKFMKHCQLIQAKVPILRIEMAGEFEGLDIDLNVNNCAGIYNSYLLHYYARVDDRCPTLCLLVKNWAKINGVADAMSGFLNSYSLILLCIHFLQAVVKPAILPNLQHVFPDLFSGQRALDYCLLFQDLNMIYPDPRNNKSTVGELLIAFFDYYAKFDFDNYAISVARGTHFPRSELEESSQRYKIFVEEPYDFRNTARCVTHDWNYDLIRETFRSARQLFLGKKKPDLRNLGITELYSRPAKEVTPTIQNGFVG